MGWSWQNSGLKNPGGRQPSCFFVSIFAMKKNLKIHFSRKMNRERYFRNIGGGGGQQV